MSEDIKLLDEFFTRFQTDFFFFSKKEIEDAIENKGKKEIKEEKPEDQKQEQKSEEKNPILNEEEELLLLRELKRELKPEKEKKSEEKIAEEQDAIKKLPPEEQFFANYNNFHPAPLDYSNLFSYLGGTVKVNEYESFEKKEKSLDAGKLSDEESIGKVIDTIVRQQGINSGDYVSPEEKEKFQFYVKFFWHIVQMKLRHSAYGNESNIDLDKINY